MSDPETKYRCGMCDEIHDSEWQAEECCKPEIETVYACAECGEIHEDYQEALGCCVDEEAEAGQPFPRINPRILEADGQQRLF